MTTKRSFLATFFQFLLSFVHPGSFPRPFFHNGAQKGLWTIILMLFFTPINAFVVQTSVSSTNDQTRAINWTLPPIDFVVDGGTLAGDDGMPVVINALNEWDNISTATQLGGDLYIFVDEFDNPIDFTIDNFGLDYGIIDDDINEIVFDETGEILEALGLDPDYVAGIGVTIENTANQEITDAMLVVNGTIPSSPALDIEATMVHELGHIWGLSHTFIGAITTDNTEPGFYPILPEYIPTMYPFENPVDDTYGRSLEWDDIAAISSLYPETIYAPPDHIPFGDNTGTLRGTVSYKGLLPVTAAHVRAVNSDEPDIQVSCLSGFDGRGNGTFEIPGLPEGFYYLIVEGIDGRDGVTSYLIEDDGIGVCAFNGFEDFDTAMPYQVRPGEIVWGFDFQIDDLPLDDNDAVEFGLPDGFDFTFMDMDCRRVFLYSNGTVGFNRFEDPDPDFTWPDPDLHDFLSRPMARICPLRCDLDPAGNLDGRIDVDTAPGQVFFTFNQVDIVQSKNTATFEVILENTGSFHFIYDDTGGPVALTGYTSGVYDTGGMESSTDLVSYTGTDVPTAHNRVMYQLVDGTWLNDSTLSFPTPATDPLPVRNRLIYPWLADNDYFTLGFAVVSNSDTSCRLRITAFDYDGFIQPVTAKGENPVVLDLAPYEQFVVQAGQLFPFVDEDVVGWILVETDNPDPYGIQGFFLIQSYFDGVLDSLDGAVALAETDTTLVFTRFAGELDEYTEVTVVNPNAVTTDIELYVYWDDGYEEVYTDFIPPNAISIFVLDGDGTAYVVVDSVEPVTGFAMNFNQAGSLAGQSARFLWESRTEMVSPHFIYLNGSFASRLDLVNPNDTPTMVTVELVDAQNTTIGNPVDVNIDGWYNAGLDLSPGIFSFDSQGLTDGWVWISSDLPILGSMTFGDPFYAFYQSTLPLLWAPQYDTLHSHLAQGEAGGVDYLTGLAILSLDMDNDFTMDVFDSQGTFRHGIEGTLNGGERGIGLLNEWMPDGPWPQVAGYLAGTAREGMYAYEIFTTMNAEFYAAVPAQKYFPVQVEADDFNNGWPDDAEPVDGFPLEIRGFFPPDDGGFFFIDLGEGYIDEVEDLYIFNPPRPGWYCFGLFADNQWCDVDLYLFDDQWEIVDSSAFGVPGPEYIQVYLEPGDWYLGVSLFDLGWFEEAGYHLVLEPDGIY